MNVPVRVLSAWLCWAGLLMPAAAQQAACQVRLSTLQGSYVGDCIAGVASGRGRAVGSDRYEGSFRDGWPTGQGVYTFADGRRFEGEFLDGKVNGRARFHYSNGDVLEGEFRDNNLVGAGRLTPRGGEALVVEIRNGALVSLGRVPGAAAAPAPAAAPSPTPMPAATPAPLVVPAPVPVPAAVPTPSAMPTRPAASSQQWAPRVDSEDLFPSYILAASTRRPIPPKDTAATPRGDPAALVSGLEALRPNDKPAVSVRARYAAGQADANYLGDPWGMVGIKLRSTEANTQVAIRVSIDEVAEVTDATFTLPSAGVYALYPKIRYRFDKLRLVTQPTPVNVTWTVVINGQPAGTRTETVRLRSVQDAPLSVKTERGWENLSWVFAGFVTEDAPWIDELLKEAFNQARVGAIGYQSDADGVDKQVETIFNYLRARGVRYSNITTSSGESDTVYSQVVRFPSDSMRTSQANCIDGTVLLASVLRKIGIEPYIVLGPGHAILGYQRVPEAKGDGDYRFLETTMIGSTRPFVEALASGAGTFDKWAKLHKEKPSLRVFPIADYRKLGVMPIPR